jgi:hypothetical protein
LRAHRPEKYRERAEARSEVLGPVTLLQLVNASLALEQNTTMVVEPANGGKLVEGAVLEDGARNGRSAAVPGDRSDRGLKPSPG